MGLDMFLSRVPKVDSIEELEKINNRLDDAFVAGDILKELKKIKDEKDYIFDIDFSLYLNVDIPKWKKDKEGWGHIVQLRTRVAYWRKFNALHKWLVKNVQKDVDDCDEYIITIDHLEILKEDLSQINEKNKDKILPTVNGSFFGGTEYDKRYWEELNDLKSTVDFLLRQQVNETVYIFQASW